jgi:hypothetical protein
VVVAPVFTVRARAYGDDAPGVDRNVVAVALVDGSVEANRGDVLVPACAAEQSMRAGHRSNTGAND